jgi:hypothetical protein
MATTTIAVPSFTGERIANLVASLHDVVHDENRVVLDFSEVGYAEPHATLVAACAIQTLGRERVRAGRDLAFSGYDSGRAQNYLSHVGFFQLIGVKCGNAPGAAEGSRSYVPITMLRRDTVLGKREPDYEHLHFKCDCLAKTVAPNETQKRFRQALSYAFREAIRNALEHSGASTCAIMAQSRFGQVAEVAVLDAGRGIAASLADNPSHRNITPEAALLRALKPGVSRCPPQHATNAGLGLYVLSELARRNGHLWLWSSGCQLAVDSKGMRTTPGCDLSMDGRPGTAFRLRVSLASTSDWEAWFDNALSSVKEEAGGGSRSPSRLG